MLDKFVIGVLIIVAIVQLMNPNFLPSIFNAIQGIIGSPVNGLGNLQGVLTSPLTVPLGLILLAVVLMLL